MWLQVFSDFHQSYLKSWIKHHIVLVGEYKTIETKFKNDKIGSVMQTKNLK